MVIDTTPHILSQQGATYINSLSIRQSCDHPQPTHFTEQSSQHQVNKFPLERRTIRSPIFVQKGSFRKFQRILCFRDQIPRNTTSGFARWLSWKVVLVLEKIEFHSESYPFHRISATHGNGLLASFMGKIYRILAHQQHPFPNLERSGINIADPDNNTYGYAAVDVKTSIRSVKALRETPCVMPSFKGLSTIFSIKPPIKKQGIFPLLRKIARNQQADPLDQLVISYYW